MTRIRVTDPSGPGVDHTRERSEEHFVAELAQLIRGGRDRLTGREICREGGAQQLLAPERQDAFDRTVARDVDDHDADLIVGQEHDVIAVAGYHTLGGAELRGERPTPGQRTDLGLQVRTQREEHGRALLDCEA